MITQPTHDDKPGAWALLWNTAVNIALESATKAHRGCDTPTAIRLMHGYDMAWSKSCELTPAGAHVFTAAGIYTITSICPCDEKRALAHRPQNSATNGSSYCRHEWAAMLTRKACALLDAAMLQALTTWPPDAESATCPRCGLKALAVVWDNPSTTHTRICQAEITLAGMRYTCGWVEPNTH